jgi:hypothetical protein
MSEKIAKHGDSLKTNDVALKRVTELRVLPLVELEVLRMGKYLEEIGYDS